MATSHGPAEHDLLDLTVRELLERLESEDLNVGSGASCGVVVALAAALVVSCARSAAGHWDGAAGALAQADVLRRRSAPLAQTCADAYLHARAMLLDADPSRREALALALDAAALAPLRMAEVAADVALLAAEICDHGRPELAPDAAGAAALAQAASSTGRHLVAVNLLTRANDEYLARAERAAATATVAAERGLTRQL